ncbi:MAG: hypothetical protein P0120_02355 [Nitrospira sp.]|nr:hypothetical protein [Nitrospira sp.]
MTTIARRMGVSYSAVSRLVTTVAQRLSPWGKQRGCPEWHLLKGYVADVTYKKAAFSDTVGLPNHHRSITRRASLNASEA